MPEALYIPGEIARASLSVTDLAGAVVDPSSVVIRVKSPAGVTTTYTYGTDAIIVRDAAGNFHADIVLTGSGLWAYRWEIPAPNAGAAEGVIAVAKSRVL